MPNISPIVLKGAIVSLDPNIGIPPPPKPRPPSPPRPPKPPTPPQPKPPSTPSPEKHAVKKGPSIIEFQYNPDEVTRSLKPQPVSDEPDRTEIFRLKGPPIETIRCTIDIDATDLMASRRPDHAWHSASSRSWRRWNCWSTQPVRGSLANEALSFLGTIEILPMESKLTLFVWSKSRVTPVLITDLDITEEAFDPQLNPIRAKVALGMRVLNVNDVGFLTPAGVLYMAYQIQKEALATMVP